MDRLRRLRKSRAIRDLVAQTHLDASNFIMPYFVCEGKRIRQPIKSMPGIFRLSQDELLKEIDEIKQLGIKAIILFGIPKNKDDKGISAYREDGVIQKTVFSLKKSFGDDLAVITDVCLCGYTKHGHCGIIKAVDSLSFMGYGKKKNKSYKLSAISYKPEIDNDATLEVLAKVALSHAQAGVDILAPSAMMDGEVAAIRNCLDENGFKDAAIMSYSAKFASNFYGPFREAADSSMRFGDRKSYQLDFRNAAEALREIELDIQEGADIVMVKPALAYLDIITKAREKFNVPIAAYNVSGEYAMVKAYLESLGHQVTRSPGAEKDLVLEILTAIKRAGADIIISYWAKDASSWLNVSL
jgi:porphobilinogen synthase